MLDSGSTPLVRCLIRMNNKKTKHSKSIRLFRNLLFDKRAVSVALTTMIITAGVIAAGIAVLYWAYSWGNVADNQYSSTVSNNQNAIQENLAFEYVTYSSTNYQLTVYVINCGLANSINFTRLYIWNSANQPIGTFPITQLYSTKDQLNYHQFKQGRRRVF